jgi:glycolate dehydrogenase FAD-binding subunit
VIVRPGTYEEVGAVVRFANERGLAVIPQGHGAVTGTGNTPRGYDVALSVARLNKTVEYEPADLTISCQAGAILEELPLGSNGQVIPFVGKKSSSCVGRLLAHPMREANADWGAARDFTIGLRVVTADGRIIRTGGKVVKNVAGYDLTKLFIGSRGTLGVIVEATFKLAPAPQAEEEITFEFARISDGCELASALRRRNLALSTVRVTRSRFPTDGQRGLLTFGFELAGSNAAVARSRAEIESLAASANGTQQISNASNRTEQFASSESVGDALSCIASVLPSAVPSLVDAIDNEAPGAWIEGFPLAGSIGFTWLGARRDEDLVRRVWAVTARLGGNAIMTGCSPELKRQIDVFGEVPPKTLELMRRVKQQFDPKGILSPGRFVGRI